MLNIMNEIFPDQEKIRVIEREKKLTEIIALASELSESKETFPFSDIDPEAYAEIKAAEVEFSGYTTPIDDLLVRFKNEGMKVALSNHPESGNIYILPAQSNDVVQDGISPRQISMSETMNEKLKKLISLSILFSEFLKAK